MRDFWLAGCEETSILLGPRGNLIWKPSEVRPKSSPALKDSVRDISFFSSSVKASFQNSFIGCQLQPMIHSLELSESNEFENLAKRPVVIPSCISNFLQLSI